MQTRVKNKTLHHEVEQLLKRIPFFKRLCEQKPAQFQRLIHLGQILEADPGNTVICPSQTADSIYVLLKGQLNVLLDRSTGNTETVQLNTIFAGEMFGTLAFFSGRNHSTHIQNGNNATKPLIFKLDSQFVNESSSYCQLCLKTQTEFYRFAHDNIRWLLEQNKMSSPSHALVTTLRKLRLTPVKLGCPNELEALKDQCKILADIALQWVDSYQNIDNTENIERKKSVTTSA